MGRFAACAAAVVPLTTGPTTQLPAWARKGLETLPDGHAALTATRVGWRHVLATTPRGAALVTRRLLGKPRTAVLEAGTAAPSAPVAREPRTEFDADDDALDAGAEDGAALAEPVVRLRLPGAPAAPRAAARPAADDGLRPQCSALTAAGAQCRSSARDGSRYCISHKGYQPPGEKKLATLLDTAPAVSSGDRDRLAAVRGRGAGVEAGAQCAAVTAAGAQCRNVARGGSKYCAPHKGFQPPTAGAVARTRDTAPAVAGAPDTAPAVRRRSA